MIWSGFAASTQAKVSPPWLAVCQDFCQCNAPILGELVYGAAANASRVIPAPTPPPLAHFAPVWAAAPAGTSVEVGIESAGGHADAAASQFGTGARAGRVTHSEAWQAGRYNSTKRYVHGRRGAGRTIPVGAQSPPRTLLARSTPKRSPSMGANKPSRRPLK